MIKALFTKRTKQFTCIALFFLPLLLTGNVSWAQTTTVFSDDFSTNTNAAYTTSGAIGASAWSVNASGVDFGARRNTSPAQLELTNDATAAANVNGWALANTPTASFSSPYNTTLGSNTGAVITWSFNMRQIRPDPAGLGSGSYGVAYVLAGTSTTTQTLGSGWAVALGQSGSTDPVRLIKYTAGLATSTNVITSNTTGLTDFGAEYLSIQVKYTQATNTWELLLRNDGATAFADPLTGTLVSQGTAVDAANTAAVLGLMGGFWSGSTTAAQTAFFDNVSVKVTTVPSGNTLAAYSTQLTGDLIKGNNNLPLAGFTFTPTASTDFTSVTVTGATATSSDLSNMRIYRDNNGNGIIDGADASVSGAGIAFGASMVFTLSETGVAAVRSYLIVGDVAFTATAGSVQVSISSGNYTTSAGTNSGSMPSVSRNLVSPPGTSLVTAGAATEPASISSLINTQVASVLNFDISIQDDGGTPGTDAVDTKISQLVFSQGTGNDVADWTVAIAGAELSDGTNTQTGTIGAASITFSSINIATLGLIGDNATKTYTLKVWLKSDLTTLKTTIDGANLVFRIQNGGITADNTGSQLASGQDQNSGATNNAVDVTATGLAYVQNTSTVATNSAMSPAVTVAAIDANGNRDLGFTGGITISSTGTLSGLSTNSATATSGLATFSNIIHSVAQTGRMLNAERSSPDGDWDIASASFDVVSTTVTYSTLGSTYTQNFDGFSSTSTASWSNGTTPLQGWFAVAPLAPYISPTTLTVQNGSGTSAALANFGVTANTNRSLGWVYANTVGAAGSQASIGVGLVNATGATITQYTLAYTGRQWRTDATSTESLVVEYKIGGSFDNNSSGWTAIPSLTFTEPNSGAAATIDGTLSGNFTALSANVSSISWPDGATIWIRWRDTNDPNTDAQLAIDNVNFSTPAIANTDLAPYASQLSSNVIKGNINVPLAGFTVTPTAALNFTGVTVTGNIATLTDVTNVRIFSDNNGNGVIDGADASASGAGIAFAASMPFTFTQALIANMASSYLVVGDIAFNGTSADVTVGITGSTDFSTSTGTRSGSMPAVTRTIETPLGTSTITAGPGAEPATISSLLNTQGAAILNFDFTINDDGATPSTDFEPTDISFITVTQGTGNDVADWTQVIAGAEISDGTNTATGTVNAGNLTFDFSAFPPDGAISISDDESKTFSVKLWLKSDLGSLKTTIDGLNLVFKINPAGISFAGSSFLSAQEQNSGASNNAIAVTATALSYVQNTTNAGVGSAMTPAVTVSANDINGNRDLDFTEQVRVTSTGTLTGSPVDAVAIAGLATFSTLTHSAGGTGLTLNAERTNTLDWDVASNPFNITIVTSATDFFRSNVASSGNWNVAGSWESSPDGNSWITSTMVPNNNANTITIRTGDSILITTATTADQVVIQTGATLIQSAAFTVNAGAGDDIIVQSGGIMIYKLASTTPAYTSSTIHINTDGILSLQATGITAAASVIYGVSHIYDNGSILEWGITNAPSSSGITFFPNVDAATVPVLRFVAGTTQALGGSGNTVVNGIFEVTAPGLTVTFSAAGTKTFRNGIRGPGAVVQASTSGQFIINGATAQLGGGTLTLNTAGLTINSGTTTTMSSNKTIAGIGTSTINGVLNLNGFTLTAGAIAGTGTLSGSAASSLVLNATGTLRFTTGAQTLKNLTVNTGTATLASALDITAGTALNTSGTVTIGTGAVLASAGNLTLKSNEFGTARVAPGPAGNYLTGDVTVERFIPNSSGYRTWRLLSIPTSGVQTIKASWQEGNAALGNSKPNFGTQITGPGGTGAGFDNTASSSSMLTWNGTGWSNVLSTLGAISADPYKAYFLFVRGERTKGIQGTNANTSATTLETRGNIYTGDQTINITGDNSFSLVPNLYPSAIKFTTLTKTNVDNTYYIWDSKITSNGTLTGKYQTFTGATFFASSAGGSYDTGVTNDTIESGQAFLVHTTASGAHSVTMHETDKIGVINSNLGLRPATPAALVKIDARLYTVSGNNRDLADGNTVVFDNIYSGEADRNDAAKLSNPGENFAILTGTKSLAVEARPAVNAGDIIYFKMWNLHQQPYQLEFAPANLANNGLTAELEDAYLRISTPVSLEAATLINFTVDANTASFAAGRFRLVFRQAAPLPVSFMSISASRIGTSVQVDWKVAAERNIRSYGVERSTDGRNFSRTGILTASGNSTTALSYQFTDVTAPAGTLYYRIKSTGTSGEIKYTTIVKVMAGDVKPGFAISPNPAEGSIVNLQFTNKAEGRYTITLLGTTGQVIFSSAVMHAGGNSTQVLNLPKGIARGVYQAEIISPDNSKSTQKLVISN